MSTNARITLIEGYSRRDRAACLICNFVLNHIAGPKYRAMIGGSIRYGLRAAMLDEIYPRSSSGRTPDFESGDAGSTPDRGVRG